MEFDAWGLRSEDPALQVWPRTRFCAQLGVRALQSSSPVKQKEHRIRKAGELIKRPA